MSDVKYLHGHGHRKPADLLDEAAAWCRAHDLPFDTYATARGRSSTSSSVGSPSGWASRPVGSS